MHGLERDRSVAERYRRFARLEARGKSPLYERLCEGVADDRELLGFLATQPADKRQPNLLLAAVRHRFGTPPDYAAFRAAVLGQPAELAAELAVRRTQTNEPGRCAALLPVLAALPQPLALLEVGAAAGLCLLGDRYAYAYGPRRVGAAEVVFPCAPLGPVPVPERPPEVAWRAGIDLDPIDLGDADAVAWLEALVWPEERDRLDRLRAAVAIARRDPPRVVAGDLVERLQAVADEAPAGATLVVFHTAVLAYLAPARRAAFAEAVRALPGAVWIANEAPGVVASAPDGAPTAPAASHFVIARDGRAPLARCDPHGRWLQWLG
jgi:hypothetical protein